MPLEVQVKQFLKENIICNGDMSPLIQKGRLLHKISYNQGIQKVKETRNENNFCKGNQSEGNYLEQKSKMYT